MLWEKHLRLADIDNFIIVLHFSLIIVEKLIFYGHTAEIFGTLLLALVHMSSALRYNTTYYCLFLINAKERK